MYKKKRKFLGFNVTQKTNSKREDTKHTSDNLHRGWLLHAFARRPRRLQRRRQNVDTIR